MDNSDVLSDVFSTLRIHSELYFQAELRDGFSIELPPEKRRVRFHLVQQGHCWLRVPGQVERELNEGDLAIVPDGAGQILSSGPQIDPIPLAEVLAAGALDQGLLRYGSGERRARLLCGFCHFDEAIDHPVLTSLPALLLVRAGDLGAEPWTAAALRLLSMEADLKAQGSKGILTRLLEIVFIQSVRRMKAELEDEPAGFIAALHDVKLSKALQAIHNEPQVKWTIGGLAKLAGMSRARFAERFTATVGVPPVGYLTHWRLSKARNWLASSELDMAEIASRCGYASVPSFSKRFKEVFGVGPGAYRRSSRS
ncbi:AraC family transcriptional regulator [Pelagibius sp. Alg239-R121]|uniref:AraC family transcriptional regulator n=1 Tax=Pelagibius sp. Alg239-R121 TaxID=2993448 RepID=UPI0024A6A2B0|nr:AraC family transcriptional regulator [Pelagibius sp. Alg239-R121]